MGAQGWSEELASGSEDLDAQHREFFQAIDRFEAAQRQAVVDLLEFLEKFAREHFALEESYMAVYRYPQAEAHRAAHRAITAQLVAARARLDAEGPTEGVRATARDIVNVGLREQITAHDVPFIAFLKTQEPSSP